MAILSEQELRAALAERRHWRRVGDTLVRERALKDFAEALAFVERVGQAVDDWGRHPDVSITGGNRTRITVTNTHGAGFTDAELRMVAKVDEVADAPLQVAPAPTAAPGGPPAETAQDAPGPAAETPRRRRGVVLAAGVCGIAVGAAGVLAARRL
jgi:4a-hydroxytetrahydrobiopterin dehydratase